MINKLLLLLDLILIKNNLVLYILKQFELKCLNSHFILYDVYNI